jgi:thioredoxin 1
MASEHVHAFTNDNFDAEVLRSDVPVLVDFWAEWCVPCNVLAPTIDELGAEFAGKAKVGKVDTEEGRDIAMRYDISAIPTVIIFKGGSVVGKFVGLSRKADLANALNEAIG